MPVRTQRPCPHKGGPAADYFEKSAAAAAAPAAHTAAGAGPGGGGAERCDIALEKVPSAGAPRRRLRLPRAGGWPCCCPVSATGRTSRCCTMPARPRWPRALRCWRWSTAPCPGTGLTLPARCGTRSARPWPAAAAQLDSALAGRAFRSVFFVSKSFGTLVAGELTARRPALEAKNFYFTPLPAALPYLAQPGGQRLAAAGHSRPLCDRVRPRADAGRAGGPAAAV